MKKLLLTTAVLAASIGSAFAADLPSVKAPPVIALPPPVWTGFYAGVNGGFGGGYGDATLAILGPIAFGFASANTTNMNFGYGDFFIGGQAGYNYQLANRIVLGIETDMQWSGISARASANNVAATLGPGGFGTAAVFSGSAHFGQEWFGTTRLRVGYALTDSFMPYITGGVAYSQLSGAIGWTTAATFVGLTSATYGSYSDTKVGWTIGAGVEYLITPNISFKTEYLYSEYGNLSVPVAQIFPGAFGGPSFVAFGTLQSNNDFAVHTVRAGVNWKFGWAPPAIVAKY